MEFTAEDAVAVHPYVSNAEVARHMMWGPNTEEETVAFIKRALTMQKQQQPRMDYELAVVRKETGELIGGCGLHISEPSQGEIGYCFHPSYWRQGFASESAGALLQFGFRELNLHRIYATCRPENAGSAKVLEKIGMKLEGHLRGHMKYKGEWRDSFQYSILEDEYTGPARNGHN
jgi:RimJ/RimL family protein N-acetyltransferase